MNLVMVYLLFWKLPVARPIGARTSSPVREDRVRMRDMPDAEREKKIGDDEADVENRQKKRRCLPT